MAKTIQRWRFVEIFGLLLPYFNYLILIKDGSWNILWSPRDIMEIEDIDSRGFFESLYW